jgi:adenylate cyclase
MERRLAAILSYDIAGYSLAIGRDEAGTLEVLRAHRRDVIEPAAKRYGGRIIKYTGDGALVEFASAVDATCFALALQTGVAERNAGLPDAQRLDYRVGVVIGDVAVDGDDVYGDGVNMAVRVEGQAHAGGICIHQGVREQLGGRLDLDFEDMGDVEVKNIERPIRVFRIIVNEKALAALDAYPKAETPKVRGKTSSWMTALAAVIVVAVLGGLGWWQPWATDFEPVDPSEMAQPLPEKPSLAVLAFDDISTGDDQGYLSDAIAEGIITELARFTEFFVIARNSSFQYKDTASDVREIAKELGVHYLLEGSQQKNGDRLRVTAQLIDALAGTHIWAETYDRDLADLFAVQDEIVREVASAVGAKVAFRPPPSGGLAKVSALHYNLQGRPYIRQWTRDGTRKALELNLAAVDADPDSPFGYIGLAFAYPRAAYGWLDMDGDEGLRRAEEAAEKALALDPDNYDAHYARAFVYARRGEQELAIQRYKVALDLNPSAANVMAALSSPLMYSGRVDEALEVLERAVRLDPHHPDWFKWNLAWAQWAKGDCESALSTMRAMTNMPNMARRMLAVVQICLGQKTDAKETIAAFLENEPGYTIDIILKESKQRYTDTSILDRYTAALKQAGLPE